MSILLELFDRKVEWELLVDTRSIYRAQFIIDELTYEVALDGKWIPDRKLSNPDELFNDIWEITFIMFDNKKYFSNEKITGTGNAILVFSTVIDIISHAVDSKNIQTLTFSANHDEPTRVKLYDRMAAVFAKKGWRYIGTDEIRARSDAILRVNSYYLLTKHPKPAQQA